MSPLPIPTHTVPVAELPKDFTWGVATAAYQIEGGTSEGGRTASIWDTFSATPGSTFHGDTGEQACDHFHRWPEDVEILGNIGVSAYRLSFSWTRLQPSGSGPLNPEGVSFYRALLVDLRARSVTPWVTLYHWDLPQELEDLGGWPNRDTAHAFEAYVALVVTEFADLVRHWITINEPYCAAFLGYGFGVHAPGRKSISDAVAAGHHLMLAHGLATATIRSIAPTARIGISNIVMTSNPAAPHRKTLPPPSVWTPRTTVSSSTLCIQVATQRKSTPSTTPSAFRSSSTQATWPSSGRGPTSPRSTTTTTTGSGTMTPATSAMPAKHP